MKKYRDELVAHHEKKSRIPNFPKLDIAFDSSCYYYDYLCRELASPGAEHLCEDLQIYAQRFHDQAKTAAKAAIEATKDIQENVR